MDLPNFQNAKRWWKALKEWPLRYRILLVIVVFAIVCIVCIPFINTFLQIIFNENAANEQEKPMFLIPTPNIRIGSNTLIVAENNAANVNSILKVEYDGIVFPKGGIPIPGSNPQMWFFTLHDKELPENMLKEGVHHLRFGFLGGDFYSNSTIIISKKNPAPFIDLAEIEISNLENAEINTIEVHTARDLIKEIKPNTIIKLAKGTYNLTLASRVKSKYVEWLKVYDGFEPLIHSIYNFQIIGQPGAKILIEPKYAWVMSFQNSKNIKLENLIAGHAVSGYCLGGVFSFVNSEDIEINNSVLFGCGTTGIQIDKVDNLKFSNSTIGECSYDMVGVYNSTNVIFENSTFKNTTGFNLISITDFAYNIKFSKCLIQNNANGKHFPYLIDIGEDTGDIYLFDSKIIGNNTTKFINHINRITMRGNTFLNNSFSDFSDKILNQKIN